MIEKFEQIRLKFELDPNASESYKAGALMALRFVEEALNAEKGERCPSISMSHLLECDECRTKYGIGSAECQHEASYHLVCMKCGKLVDDRHAKPSAVGEEEIVKILKEYTTHILWYHDKECGRTEDVEIIFASRITKLAHTIMERIR